MNQEDQQQDQSYDFGGYDLQGYDVQAYEEQGFDTQAYQEEAQDPAAYYDETVAEEPPMASAQARVPQAAPAYEDAAAFADDEDDEDFPEPEEAPKKKGGNGRTMALAGVGALAVAGAVLVFNPLGLDLTPVTDMLPAEVTAMLPTGAPADEAPAPEEAPADQAPPPAEDAEPAAPPPDADSKEWQEPVAMKKEAQPEAVTPQAAKPKPKPAEAAKPKPAAKAPAKPAPKPAAPVAKKPAPPKPAPVAKKPVPAKPKPAAVPMAGGPSQASSVVRFERNSAWVAAAEMERLWAFSSKIRSGHGHITIEGVAGSEREASDLARRRAIRVAELLKTNNVGNQFKFTVKAITAPGDSPRVNVSYSQKL